MNRKILKIFPPNQYGNIQDICTLITCYLQHYTHLIGGLTASNQDMAIVPFSSFTHPVKYSKILKSFKIIYQHTIV